LQILLIMKILINIICILVWKIIKTKAKQFQLL
jgi:hypothetical protein